MAISEYQEQEVQRNVLVKDLSEVKRRLLQQCTSGMAPRREHEQIRPRPAGTAVPLSAEQRRIWLHASHQPDSPIYNEPFTVYKYGAFNLRILEASVNEILRRHEAWRTSFSSKGEAVVHHDMRITLPLRDLSGLPLAEREAEALRLATEDAQKPIALHDVPLLRAQVVRMAPEEHRLYIVAHHIILDAISISRIFMPELAAVYSSFEQGRPSPLTFPALQYGDYAVWREQQVDSPVVKQHLAYWLEQLSDELPILHLPGDRPRPAIRNYRGSMECFEVPDDLLRSLRRLCNEQGTTLYMALLAAFKVLLFRYSGQSDLIVGSVTGSRMRPELEDVMGNFLHTFAVRTRPVAASRFSDYLAQVRNCVLECLVSADVPFDRVVQAVNPKRDASQHPIFQAFFSVRPAMPLFSEGWNLSQMDVTVEASKFDLFLEVCELPERMEARFLYSTEIWDASTIRRMSAHWLMLLQSICRNPESALGSLALPAIPLTPRGKIDRAQLPAPTAAEIRPLPMTLRSSQEVRVAAIWEDLLGCKHIGLDDNFFDLGGHSLLVAMLQQRIAAECGQHIPFAQLFHNPTVRQQAELTQRLGKGGSALPPGVLALQPRGTRNGIFWVHYLNVKLAKAIGDDQPFLVVSPTAEDMATLGKAPTLQSIAACQLRKILATQANGPYIIGGQCVSGVLAYEIASQLRANGQEVSLVVLLDTPSPTYWEPRDSLARKLTYCRYLVRRTWQCGLRKSLAYVYELLSNQLAGMLRTESARTEMRVVQETMEAAARPYQPERYDGNVLLVLASDHPPNRNLLSGWQAVIPRSLHIQRVNAHHRDLMDAQNVRNIADAITKLISRVDDKRVAETMESQGYNL
jgi:thioesterase domain-containing protein/aryl carrier-like protein